MYYNDYFPHEYFWRQKEYGFGMLASNNPPIMPDTGMEESDIPNDDRTADGPSEIEEAFSPQPQDDLANESVSEEVGSPSIMPNTGMEEYGLPNDDRTADGPSEIEEAFSPQPQDDLANESVSEEVGSPSIMPDTGMAKHGLPNDNRISGEPVEVEDSSEYNRGGSPSMFSGGYIGTAIYPDWYTRMPLALGTYGLQTCGGYHPYRSPGFATRYYPIPFNGIMPIPIVPVPLRGFYRC
ncbi:hypothetical protein [Oceanobacillus senegalensis]|uniref:hypothetical protein n=1 Tax=Oceanobacillus senegalensis TaxID=1936063 RepID=UPI000A30FDDD|nr:hypothetical protein [Oceanobacillus senegalensis]